MSLLKNFLRVAITAIVFLVLFTVIGVVVSEVLDILPIRGKTSAMVYVLWFVLGVFVGFLTFAKAGTGIAGVPEEKWVDSEYARAIGVQIIVFSLLALAGLALALHLWMWRGDMESGTYVPDSARATLTFFASAWLGTIAAQITLGPRKPST